MISKLDNNLEFISRDGELFEYVKLSTKTIKELKSAIEENPNLIIWIDPIGLHEYGICFDENNFDILNKFSCTRMLIQSNPIEKYRNISGLYSQKQLVELDIVDLEEYSIDFKEISKLKKLSFTWNNLILNFFSCTSIEKLSIWKFKDHDLTKFSIFTKLEYLKICQSGIISMCGIEKLRRIKTLILGYNKNLEIDKGLVFTGVEDLEINTCKKISIDFVKNFPNLKRLELQNQGSIETLAPILDGLPKLEEIIIGATKIEESDNRYWLNYPNIKRFYFSDMRHHILKSKDVEEYYSKKIVKNQKS